MSSLLRFAVKYSRPVARIFRPAVFFSSTASFSKDDNDNLLIGRKFVKEMLLKKGFYKISHTASQFSEKDVEALRVNIKPAHCNCQIIPDVDVEDFSKKYIIPKISSRYLNDDVFRGIGDDVKTFILKLNWATSYMMMGTTDSDTDTLVDDLLRITKLNTYPLVIRKYQKHRLHIGERPYLLANPEYTINMKDKTIIVMEDKYLGSNRGEEINDYGESQLVAEILACADENRRKFNIKTDQTIYVFRILTTYITFYKAVIPVEYLLDFKNGLPQYRSIEILKWPKKDFHWDGKSLLRPTAKDIARDGLDLKKPEERCEILEALVKFSQYLKMV